MTIGQRIRIARKSQHMTQQELADSVGITRKALASYELGKSSGEGFYTLGKICKALSVSADWVLGLK